jgi:Uma2 family endonuclease
MSHQAKPTYVTPGEYLTLERSAEYKSEYFAGQIFALVGASRRHNLIALNIGSELRAQLKGRDCEVYVSDMRVRIPSSRLYTYPDVVAVSSKTQFEDAEVDTLLNPVLICEVLSQTTAAYDRFGKFSYYRTIESLTEYLLVAQDEYRVEQYTKQADGRWLLADIRGLENRIELASVECTLALSEVYDRVSLA